MASKGKEKGNRFQRVARDLIQKWTHKKFTSTASDGGIGYNRDPHKGDLKCITEGHFCPFSFECKHYEDINFSHLLIPGIKNIAILDFWAQCIDDAQRQKKVPLLMMRYNGLPKTFCFVVVSQEFAKLIHVELALKNFGSLKSLRYHDYKMDKPIMILQSDQFFRTDYKAVKKIAKQHIKELYEKN